MELSKGIISIAVLIVVGLLLVGGVGIIIKQTAPGDTNLLVDRPAVITTTPIQTPTTTPTETPPPSPSIPSPSPTPTTATVGVPGPPSAGYSRYNISTEVGTFLVDVVSIPASSRMITDTGNNEDCGDGCVTLSLADYVARNGGFAGINGSYFCPAAYDSCAGKADSYDFPVWNSRLSKWINGGNLFWNNRSIFYQDGGGVHFNATASNFGGGLNAGIVNHPGLLDGGNVIATNFGTEAKQTAKGMKSGIGTNGSQIFLVVARGVSVTDFAHVFKSLGATHALNLDGGGSVALWYDGYKVGPGRNIPNAIIFAN